jgi:hypothetical protein
MAYDEGLADVLRGDLAEIGGISETKMFGGLAFMQRGHMVCGIYRGGAMFRVGKPNEAAACAIDGVTRMEMSGRPMTGMVVASDEIAGDDDLRGRIMALCLSFVASLPPK